MLSTPVDFTCIDPQKQQAQHLHRYRLLVTQNSLFKHIMNAVPNQSGQFDWVINYVEINSRPVPNDEFRRIRIINGQIKIDPAGIVLSIGDQTENGLVLKSASTTYLCNIVQRGNELVVKLQRVDEQGSVLIVAKKSVCKFETKLPSAASGTFKGHFDGMQSLT